MNNINNEVKQLLAKVSFHLAKKVPQEKILSLELLKLLLPTLVNGTKEKNVYVKANSEIALIALLKLKDGDTMYQVCIFRFRFETTSMYVSASTLNVSRVSTTMSFLEETVPFSWRRYIFEAFHLKTPC